MAIYASDKKKALEKTREGADEKQKLYKISQLNELLSELRRGQIWDFSIPAQIRNLLADLGMTPEEIGTTKEELETHETAKLNEVREIIMKTKKNMRLYGVELSAGSTKLSLIKFDLKDGHYDPSVIGTTWEELDQMIAMERKVENEKEERFREKEQTRRGSKT